MENHVDKLWESAQKLLKTFSQSGEIFHNVEKCHFVHKCSTFCQHYVSRSRQQKLVFSTFSTPPITTTIFKEEQGQKVQRADGLFRPSHISTKKVKPRGVFDRRSPVSF